jgi:hypothetical protein
MTGVTVGPLKPPGHRRVVTAGPGITIKRVKLDAGISLTASRAVNDHICGSCELLQLNGV